MELDGSREEDFHGALRRQLGQVAEPGGTTGRRSREEELDDAVRQDLELGRRGRAAVARMLPRRLVLPLRRRPFRPLVAGRLASQLGDWLTLAALVGWAFEATRSTGLVALFLLARLAPPVVGSGLAAAVVDRVRTERLLVWLESGRALGTAGILAAVVAGSPALALLAITASSVLAAIASVAVSASVPDFVPDEELAPANSAVGVAGEAGAALGSLGGGLVLALLGPVPALVADLVSHATAAVLFRRAVPPQRRARGSGVRESEPRARLAELIGTRVVAVALASFCIAVVATGLVNATLPRYFGDVLELGGGAYGLAFAALSAGLAAGQALVGALRVARSPAVWIGPLFLVTAVLIAGLAVTREPAVAFALLALVGIVDGAAEVLFDTTIQREAAPGTCGRVFGLSGAAISAAMMGAIAAAPLVNRLGSATDTILVAVAVLVAAGAVGSAAAWPRLEARAPAQPAGAV